MHAKDSNTKNAAKRNFKGTSHSERDFSLYNGNLFPEKIFGDADATNEWNLESYKPSATFVHTDSYETFKDKTFSVHPTTLRNKTLLRSQKMCLIPVNLMSKACFKRC